MHHKLVLLCLKFLPPDMFLV